MKRILTGLLVVLFVSTANAGMMFEPYVGYELGNYKTKLAPALGGLNLSGVANGVGAGARLAYMFPVLLFIGVDGQYSSVKFEDKTADEGLTKTNDTATRTAGYLLGGFEFLMGFRVYAGYGVYNKLEVNRTGTTTTYTGGTNMKLGVGFRLVPKVTLNFEYITRTYDSYDTGGPTKELKNLYESFNDNTIMVALGLVL